MDAGWPTHLVSRDGGSEPRWSRNGRELFFKSNNTLMAAPVTSTSTFASGTPVPLFSVAPYRSARNRQQYDVAPDGQRFLMIREAGTDGAQNLVYADNWLAELKAKLKDRR
jgi:hypothetical protein